MFKRVFVICLLCLTLSGCYSSNGQILLFNKYALFGTSPETIKVEKGDTLYSLSKKYDISISDLIEANNLSSPDQLYAGQVLKTPMSNGYHIVKKGDTLTSISKTYGISVSALAAQNRLKAPYVLNIGQKLALSASKNTKTQSLSKAQSHPKAQSIKKAPAKSANSFKKAPAKTQKIQKTSKTQQRSTYTPVKKRTTKFLWPVRGKVISHFGTIGKGRKNDGINISAVQGTAVKAADAGTVAYAGNELKGFGNLILIKHPDGWITAYAHNQKLLVAKGQKVKKGEKIATVGKTGGVNTPQLHFEVRAGKKAVNPRNYLP